MDSPTAEQLVYLTEIDYVDTSPGWRASPRIPRGSGSPGNIRLIERPDTAEAAVAVLDGYQGKGLGTVLLQALGAVAPESGIRRFVTYALEDNAPVLEALRSLGARLTGHDSPGVVQFDADLPSREEELEQAPLYRVLRAAARGEAQSL